MTSYTTETIIINNPSQKLMDLVEKARDHKRLVREETRKTQPLFTLHA